MPAHSVLPIPDAMTMETASVFRVSYGTAYYALVDRGPLGPGETLLVLGADGAIGSASTEGNRELARLSGADATIDTKSSTWRDDVKAANDGQAVDVVLDPIGEDATKLAFRSLAWKGRRLLVGFASGDIARLPVNLALLKCASVVGVDTRQFDNCEPDRPRANMDAPFAIYHSSGLNPKIARVYDLPEYAEALTDAFSGQSTGRIVLKMR